MFVMKDELLTGVELVDDEHRELFRIGRSAYDLLNDESKDGYKEILGILKELREYAATHFADEEEYIFDRGAMDYLNAQKNQHDFFIQKIMGYDLEVINEHPRHSLLDILDFLNKWLVNHISKVDSKIREL